MGFILRLIDYVGSPATSVSERAGPPGEHATKHGQERKRPLPFLLAPCQLPAGADSRQKEKSEAGGAFHISFLPLSCRERSET
jgi:hypothetical protein